MSTEPSTFPSISAHGTAPVKSSSFDLLKDQKAWLYFFAASLPVMGAVRAFTWQSLCLAAGAGCLAVKAYTSEPPPKPDTSEASITVSQTISPPAEPVPKTPVPTP